MTLVLLVDGYGFRSGGALPGLDDVAIVKRYQDQGAEVQIIRYNNITTSLADVQGAGQDVLAAAQAYSGSVVIIGVSLGSQVLCALLRWLWARDGATKQDDWSFILLANPEHKWTGKVQTPQWGGVGIPAATPYSVTDVAGQYDSYADTPNRAVNTVAEIAARAWVKWVGGGVHTLGYFHLDPDLPFNAVREGNVTHMWATTDQQANNTLIERAYDRPVKPGRKKAGA